MKNGRRLALITTFLSPFLWFTLPKLGVPNLNPDEAYPALPAITMLYGAPNWYGSTFLDIGSLRLPLSIIPYHRALESYLVAPFLLAFGTTTEALRLYGVFFGAAALLCAFFFFREYLGDERAAWGAAFLLATLPTFVFRAHMGMFFGISLPAFFLAALWCFAVWRRTSRKSCLYGGCFLLGCAAACRGWFVYCLLALSVFAVIRFAKGWYRSAARDPGPLLWKGLSCLVFFGLGAMPLLVHIVLNARRLASFFAQRFPVSRVDGVVDNLDYFGNLRIRFQHAVFLAGDGPISYDAVRVYAVFFSFLWLLVAWYRSRGRTPVDPRLLLPCYFAVFMLVSPFTVSTLKDFHIQTLVPLFAIVVSFALSGFIDRFLGRLGRNGRTAVFTGILLLLASLDIGALIPPSAETSASDVERRDASKRLADWLMEERMLGCVTNSFKLQTLLVFHSAGRIQPVLLPEAGADGDWKGARRYLLRKQRMGGDPEEDRLAAIHQLERTAELLTEFTDPGGEFVVQVYRLPAIEERGE